MPEINSDIQKSRIPDKRKSFHALGSAAQSSDMFLRYSEVKGRERAKRSTQEEAGRGDPEGAWKDGSRAPMNKPLISNAAIRLEQRRRSQAGGCTSPQAVTPTTIKQGRSLPFSPGGCWDTRRAWPGVSERRERERASSRGGFGCRGEGTCGRSNVHIKP